MAGVLDGIKVLDFTQVYSGPFCTLLLKDLGAEIIKVERPGSGDLTRNDIPHTEAGEGGPFIILNRGKKSITVDLKTEKGREIIKELVKKVDVLVENFIPGDHGKTRPKQPGNVRPQSSIDLCLNFSLRSDRSPPGLSGIRSYRSGHGRHDRCDRLSG